MCAYAPRTLLYRPTRNNVKHFVHNNNLMLRRVMPCTVFRLFPRRSSRTGAGRRFFCPRARAYGLGYTIVRSHHPPGAAVVFVRSVGRRGARNILGRNDSAITGTIHRAFAVLPRTCTIPNPNDWFRVRDIQILLVIIAFLFRLTIRKILGL